MFGVTNTSFLLADGNWRYSNNLLGLCSFFGAIKIVQPRTRKLKLFYIYTASTLFESRRSFCVSPLLQKQYEISEYHSTSMIVDNRFGSSVSILEHQIKSNQIYLLAQYRKTRQYETNNNSNITNIVTCTVIIFNTPIVTKKLQFWADHPHNPKV